VGKLISLIERTREQLANATLTTATHEDVEKALRFVRAMAKAGEASAEIPLFLDSLRRKARSDQQGAALTRSVHLPPTSRLSRVADHSWSELFVFRADSLRFLHCSPGALRNICYSQEQMARMTPLDIKPAFTKARFEELIEPLRQGTTGSVQFETVHLRNGDSVYRVEIELRLLPDEIYPVFVARGRTSEFLALRKFVRS
jgi:hypothetical protein